MNDARYDDLWNTAKRKVAGNQLVQEYSKGINIRGPVQHRFALNAFRAGVRKSLWLVPAIQPCYAANVSRPKTVHDWP
jgi:hypothetical protein